MNNFESAWPDRVTVTAATQMLRWRPTYGQISLIGDGRDIRDILAISFRRALYGRAARIGNCPI